MHNGLTHIWVALLRRVVTEPEGDRAPDQALKQLLVWLPQTIQRANELGPWGRVNQVPPIKR